MPRNSSPSFRQAFYTALKRIEIFDGSQQRSLDQSSHAHVKVLGLPGMSLVLGKQQQVTQCSSSFRLAGSVDQLAVDERDGTLL